MTLRLLLSLLLFLPLTLLATHNRAGEIIVRSADDCSTEVGQLTACVTIITYTEIEQTDVDRDSLEIFWGDGTSQDIARTLEIILPNGIKRNEYTFCHRYPTFGRYVLSFVDVNRVPGIRNIPSSDNVPFSVSTTFSLLRSDILGCNNSPEFTQIPLDDACIGSEWTHNPGAFDPDGDSLSFEFVIPEEAPGVPINGFRMPNMVGGNTGSLFIDPRTGQITWNAPALAGEFNLAFAVISYRNGIPLDTVVRDMQISVGSCFNRPPPVELEREEYCIVAGELLEFDVVATAPLDDPDDEQKVALTASSGVFNLTSNPATFTPNDGVFRDDPVRARFSWQTDCSHISDQEYFVVIRAEDDFFTSTSGLSTLRTVSIKVVAPPPQDLQTEADDELIELSWEKPYFCEDASPLVFLGFTVWRRIGSNDFEPDTCTTGLAGRGYTLLTDPETTEMSDGRFVYLDSDVERGKVYCYRVLALFGRPASNGRIFDLIESIPSEEICSILPRDLPLLTTVDVETTDVATGQINVAWLLPQAEALDTTINQGPYRYVLSRATGMTTDANQFAEIASFERPNFGDPIDTSFTDSGLNTVDNAYTYKIDFFVENENEPIAEATPASSVFLGAAPTDEAIVLNWSEMVPWTNLAYEVYRQLPGSSDFDLIATVNNNMTYRDEGLENGLEYCYYIREVGSYLIPGLPEPLLNRSQIVCSVPTDNVPPCPPVLSVESVCDRQTDCTVQDNLFNTLNWTDPADICGADDITGYRVYYSPDSVSEASFVGNIESPDLRTFDHMPETGITGCYFVTAIDSSGNESDFSNQVCVSNCPIYELPNAFTPNGDGDNDLFHPRGLCFIERVEFQIFNRWGALVFETEDPSINWDGRSTAGDVLPSGTYYYVGVVFERRLEGIVESASPVSGYIELITGE